MELSEIGVSLVKSKQFHSKGIFTVEDLLMFLPRRYNDLTKVTGICDPDKISCFVAIVDTVHSNYGYMTGKTPMIIAKCRVVGSNQEIHVKWFHQNYLLNRIGRCAQNRVYIAGKVQRSDGKYAPFIVAPEVFTMDIEGGMKVYPVYSKISGMSTEYFAAKMQSALEAAPAIEETCPTEYLQKYGQVSMKMAIQYLHAPQNMEEVKKGQARILFDDLLYFALGNESLARESSPGSPYSSKTLAGYHTAVQRLPFTLTVDQQKALDFMIQSIRSGRRINALLQGDVGCGKTIVAMLLMITLADSGFQSVLMAPTQVLAKQHYEDLAKLVEPLGYHVAFLGDSKMRGAERRKVLSEIESGEAMFIVGTQAVFSKDVIYDKLALTIVDEEQRFGVQQRATLIEKAAAGVHSITMSATPIPRSLAQALYGDTIQLHTIKSMPTGRKPVITGIATTQEKIFRFIAAEAKKGHQTYVVCPMIDRNEEKMVGVRSVEEVSETYKKVLEPQGIQVATLTGRDTESTMTATLQAFKAGTVQVLVATPVIEVGVNVPTATTMVIVNAERFGLSSLHQLRGRVGRSNLQSYCVLDSKDQTEKGQKRLQAMVDTTDGFKIAEADLAIRGAGDFLGTVQSGDNKYVSLMLAHPEEYQQAKEIARDILDRGISCKLLERAMADRSI